MGPGVLCPRCRQSGEPGWQECQHHRAQWALPGEVHQGGLQRGWPEAAGGGLLRVPRHRHGAGRPHRGRRLQAHLQLRSQGAQSASDNLQDKPGPLGGGRRHGGLRQVLPAGHARRGLAQPAPPRAEPALGHGGLPRVHDYGAPHLPIRQRLLGREQLRLRRDERARHGLRQERHDLPGHGPAGLQKGHAGQDCSCPPRRNRHVG
mmetsp:Transcript_74205/g.179479  ORF Transcript_74205/g.179479 Transcript_74205/m.179479 type:complete len:205 (+) Transcript_74205:1805-2419(+)